jgi:hypothetical protein
MDDAGNTIEARATGGPDAAAPEGGAVEGSSVVPEVPAAEAPPAEPEAGAAEAAGPPWRLVNEITVDTAIDATRLVTGELRRLMSFVAAGAVVAGIVLLFLGVPTFGPMVVLFGILTYALWNLRGSERWLLRRRWRSLIGGTQVLEIGEAGILVTNPAASRHVPWSALTEVRVGERVVGFLRERALVTFAPLEAFGPPERQAEILAFARARAGRGTAS